MPLEKPFDFSQFDTQKLAQVALAEGPSSMLAPNGRPPRIIGSGPANVAGSKLAQRQRCGAHEAIGRGHWTRGGHDGSWRADIAPHHGDETSSF